MKDHTALFVVAGVAAWALWQRREAAAPVPEQEKPWYDVLNWWD